MERINQDSTIGKTSRELDGTVCAVNSILPTPDARDSIVVPFRSMELDGTVYEENPILRYPYRSDNIVVPYTPRIRSYDILPSTTKEIMVVGYPSYVKENIFEGHGFVGEFNPRYGMSNWVSECLTWDQMKKIEKKDYCVKRGELFYEDEENYFDPIVTLADYCGQNVYARGHLAAAGNHKYNSVAHLNTFCLKNIAPMHKKVNSILARIEDQGRSFAITHNKVYSITGPVFNRERAPIFIKEGSKGQVPDAFFKVLAHEDTRKNYKIFKVFPYIVKNYPDDHEETKNAYENIYYSRRRLSSINKATGLNILSGVSLRIIGDAFPREVHESEKTDNGFQMQRTSREVDEREIMDDCFKDQRACLRRGP